MAVTGICIKQRDIIRPQYGGKMKRLRAIVLALVMVLCTVMTPTVAQANTPDWLETAEEVKIGETIDGVVPSEEWSKHWYFYVPTKMNVTFTAELPGTSMLEDLYWYDSQGERIRSVYDMQWFYDRKTNCNTTTDTVTLNKGDYYFGIDGWNNAAGNPYTFTLTAKLANNIITYTPTKKTKTSATVKWKKSSNVDGYQICRATSKKGKYTQIADVPKGTTKYVDKHLQKGKTYYYKVRAYKKIDDQTFYSSYTRTNPIKM